MFFIYLLFLGFNFFAFASTPLILENPQVMTFVDAKLPHEGILKQTQDGFLYVEIPDEYIFQLIPLISKGSICPPPYFKKGQVGAHITVAMSSEIENVKASNIPYLGKKVSFSVLHLERVILENSSMGSEAYLLRIESPQILEIRKGLGLPPKINNYDFHITIGVGCKKAVSE